METSQKGKPLITIGYSPRGSLFPARFFSLGLFLEVRRGKGASLRTHGQKCTFAHPDGVQTGPGSVYSTGQCTGQGVVHLLIYTREAYIQGYTSPYPPREAYMGGLSLFPTPQGGTYGRDLSFFLTPQGGTGRGLSLFLTPQGGRQDCSLLPTVCTTVTRLLPPACWVYLTVYAGHDAQSAFLSSTPVSLLGENCSSLCNPPLCGGITGLYAFRSCSRFTVGEESCLPFPVSLLGSCCPTLGLYPGNVINLNIPDFRDVRKYLRI